MNTAKIIFKNKLELIAEINGTCYIVDEKPEFPGDLSEVDIIYEDNTTEVLHNVLISEAYSVDGRYWFGMREMSQEELIAAKIDAQILYTATMTDTLLEGLNNV